MVRCKHLFNVPVPLPVPVPELIRISGSGTGKGTHAVTHIFSQVLNYRINRIGFAGRICMMQENPLQPQLKFILLILPAKPILLILLFSREH